VAKLVVDQVDLAGKRVFLRADFNVPLEGARVAKEMASGAVKNGLAGLGEGPGPVDVIGLRR